MKLGDLCPAPCFPNAKDFAIPGPGCGRAALRFSPPEADRDFYAVLLRNHRAHDIIKLNPKIAIVGLSPAGNQIDAFRAAYTSSGDYDTAAIAGAFAGLATDIIGMLDGLGVTQKLGINFPTKGTLAHHPDIYVTSLVACASLDKDGSSDDFDPLRFDPARRCISERFVQEITNPAFTRLTHVVILGSPGSKALRRLMSRSGRTVLEELRQAGKTVLNLPHPSGQNLEYVKLACLSAERVPKLVEYIDGKWREYAAKPPRPGRGKEPEGKYKAKRATVWRTIDDLRRQVSGL